MFKGRVYFDDEPMEYVIVAGDTEEDVIGVLDSEFYDRTVSYYQLERISEAPMMTLVPVDAYDAIESIEEE